MRHTSAQIRCMVEAVRRDVEANAHVPYPHNALHLAERHEEFCTMYPWLYRSLCKGTLKDHVLATLLTSRDAIESGKWTNQEALEYTIKEAVDHVTNIRQAERENLLNPLSDEKK